MDSYCRSGREGNSQLAERTGEFLRRPASLVGSSGGFLAAWCVVLSALAVGSLPGFATAEDKKALQEPVGEIRWERLQVGPRFDNPISVVQVILYESIRGHGPRDKDRPPICDQTYTRDEHEATIKRFEKGLAEAVRPAVPTGRRQRGRHTCGEIRVTAESGEFVVIVTNMGYSLQADSVEDEPSGESTLAAHDAFFSPVLTRELDRAWGSVRLPHYLFELLSGRAWLREHDRFLILNPDP